MQQRFYKEVERNFYMKNIATIFPTNLYTNSLLFLFCLFAETKNMNLLFRTVSLTYIPITTTIYGLAKG